MKKLLILFLFVLFVYTNSFTQTIASEKGLTTVVFDTKYAIITVYLPDDLQDGDKIFGTYNVHTAGISDDQLAKSLTEVQKYKFNFGNPVNHTNVMQTMINIKPNQLINLLPIKITSSLILSLSESYTKSYKQVIKPSSAPVVPVDDCISPEHILLGNPLRIMGTFDGNGANTRVSIGNVFFQVLAESPRQCIVNVPQNLPITENMEIKVVEDFKPKCSQSVLPVKMVIGHEKITVKKGETTNVTVTIRGLKGIEQPVKLTVLNETPDIINLKDGNNQSINITQAMLNSDYEFKKSFPVQGIISGQFSLDFKLDIPEDFSSVIEH